MLYYRRNNWLITILIFSLITPSIAFTINSSLILLTTPPPAKLDFNNSLNTAQTYIVNTSAQLAA
ncbi:MAG: hypothetical protein ACTSPQ_15820, partial [Candidatus Helarchaeota archaeon]